MIEGSIIRNYRGFGAELLNRIQTKDGVTNPEKGVRIKIITSKGNVDRRTFASLAFSEVKKNSIITQSKIPQRIEGYYDLVGEFSRLEASFALKFYLRVKAAYRGQSGQVILLPKSPRSRGTIPYYETGEFYRKGVIHDAENNCVYLSQGMHSGRLNKDGEEMSSIPYHVIYFINEYGFNGGRSSIPARPVWRPILRKLLSETELEIKSILRNFEKN